jgi:predicted O-methyltransferase YrrM
MDQTLQQLLAELEAFGASNDAPGQARAQRMLNITRDTGQFLAVMAHTTGAKNILEIGTSNGYSTLWLADVARAYGGTVTTIESAPHKVAMAAENFRKAGLTAAIVQIEGEAGAALGGLPVAAYDLIFLDSERTDYVAWWPALRRLLRHGGLLVVDNALSHADEMAPFSALVQADPAFTCALVPVGKGELLATRSGPL